MKEMIGTYVRPYFRQMGVGFLFKLIGTVMDLYIPYILAYIIDSVIPTGQRKLVFIWGGAMIVCSLLAVSFNIIANRNASRVASNVIKTVRHDLFSRIMYLSNRQLDEFTKPSMISRMTSDTYDLQQTLARIQRLGVRAPILLIGGIAVTFTLDWAMALVLVAVLPLLTLLTVSVSRRGIPIYAKLQGLVDQMVRVVREDIAGVRVIKALSKTEYEKTKFREVNSSVVEQEKKAGMVMAVMNPGMNILLNLGLVGVIITGAYRVNNGTTEVGKILAFTTYFTIILNAMLSISKMFSMISKSIASGNRVWAVLSAGEDLKVLDDEALQEVLDDKAPQEVLDDKAPQEVLDDKALQEVLDDRALQEVLDDKTLQEVLDDKAPQEVLDDKAPQEVLDDKALQEVLDDKTLQEGPNVGTGFAVDSSEKQASARTIEKHSDSTKVKPVPVPEIVFDHVTFSYYKGNEPSVKDISFCIQKGETLGIIGEIGSGKSTILNLLMRMYDADSGRIYVAGRDIRTYKPKDLKEKFGVVFQNDMIFEDTIAGNVTLGRDMSAENIQEALLYAQASEFVEGRSEQEEDALNIRGANLSGGQKQRVLIARALAARPEILILDDSSSALDYKTDASLRKDIKEHFGDTTLVIVAQRISSIRHADHILVLENGSMIGYGTHEELMEQCGIYQEISRSQMGELAGKEEGAS